ncbi:hepatocyte cell adhesion molecule-like isoform X2 [Phasianus colchicus]|uniref:Ig-like domain-containing protein n=1 Tax=Phasianus colchicus TaxID=9054 RepID=A0A669PID0_PHACC|nr:hepatocyte cell adhesion molecule-like isoform X2 [Phasianus colchicus]XP_031450227.1 hepatocyte cell adhesion molecule-like isoform X2 [Phasianus colchicus]
MSITHYVLLLFLGSCLGVEITERKLAAEGSSVMMHAPAISNVNVTEWECIKGSKVEFILQYYASSQSPVIYAAYKDRVVFYQTNGSLLLQQLQEADSGVYKATVDLMQDRARTTILEVIKPVPQPKLLKSSNLNSSLIKLICLLPNGTVAAVSWKKDGHSLTPQNYYQLTQNSTELWIRKGEKSNCGSYSCNVSNAISWEEATFKLTIAGLSPPLQVALRTTVAALALTVITAISFVIWLLQPGKHRLGKEARTWLTLPIIGLLGISCLLLFVTSVIWMQEEGPSAAFILHGLCFLAAVMTVVLIAMISQCRPEALTRYPDQTRYHVILCSTAMTLAVNLSFSCLLLHNFQQVHERGCSEPVSVIASCVFAVLAALLLLLFSFCYYKKKMDGSTQTTGTHGKKEERKQNQDKESKLSLQHPGDDITQEPG